MSDEDQSNIDAGIGNSRPCYQRCGCSSVCEQDERNPVAQPLQRKDD